MEIAKVEQTAYDLGKKETGAHLKSQITTMCHGFYLRTWTEALNTVGIDQSLELRSAKKVFYPPTIRIKVVATTQGSVTPLA